MIEASVSIDGSTTRTLPFSQGDNFPSGAVVYFLRGGERIKIGHTTDLAGRFMALQNASPVDLEMLGCIAAPISLETALHRRLKSVHIRNEWYPDCDVVRGLMCAALAGEIDPAKVKSKTQAHVPADDVRWASASLKSISKITRDESVQDAIQRAADAVGLRRWRTFDLWYLKARRLEDAERISIEAALGRMST